jgi:hypothetical protein
MAKKKKRARTSQDRQAAMALPEKLALTSLVSGTSLLGGLVPTSDPTQALPSTGDSTTDPGTNLSSGLTQVGSLSQQAQQSGPGATAENIDSSGATSSAVAPPTQPT